MDVYQQYIAKSRYSRYIDSKKRRENYSESVDRYFDFIKKHLFEKHEYTHDESEMKTLSDYVKSLQVMPSMRAIMSAGKALDRDNTAGFNCSFIPVDDPKAFDEALHILSCGTGVGFSVESRFTEKLPEVPHKIYDSETVVVVRDSKEGWAKALRQLIALLYSGESPKYDVSKVRPAGARLKTFGGRASGPEPLVELFNFVIKIFKSATGRKLKPIECHDIMCKIAEVIVVGGVRRSALISLSDLEDDLMREAKSGSWWNHNGQRALANNSAVYDSKPSMSQFMKEWTSLYMSFSGERGMFSRYASKMISSLSGRRNTDYEFGTNPCSEIILRPYQFCNLTSIVVRPEDDLDVLKKKAKLAAVLGTFQSTLTHFPYLRKIWQKNTEEERLLGVSLTGLCDHPVLSDPSEKSADWLKQMKDVVIETNKEIASKIGIQQSTATTCVKPEGTASQLNDSASGMHPRYAQYYIRRVRNDKKDPLTKFLIDQGIPYEVDVMNPSTVVFSFPRKSPAGSKMRDDKTAIEQLEFWAHLQDNWCEHKPSVTVYVKDHEWMDVGAWVYKNFDKISGVSFLPHDGGTYKQAPYEEITEDQYNEMVKLIPENIDWDSLIESDDNVEGVQTLSCSAGVCEI